MQDFEELEEGELSSGDEKDAKKINEEDLSVDYEILPRPIKAAVKSRPDSWPGSSRTLGVGQQYQQIARPSRPDPLRSQGSGGVEEDDGLYDKSSSSSDDSDDEGPSERKCRRMPSSSSMHINMTPFNFNNSKSFGQSTSTSTGADTHNAFNSQAVMFQEKRKPNNVWTQVLQDEEVSDIFGKVNVEEYDDQHVLIDRGPETFSVKYKNRPPVKHRSDSSSLSSGGLTDNELEYLKGDSFEQGAENESGMGVEEGGKVTTGLVTRLGRQTRSLKRRLHDKKKLKARRKRKNKMVRKMEGMKVEELGCYMAEKLNEVKHNLITNSIQLLGKEACIQLFLKTTKIERRGGLMIMNQQRRRTAGGVFLYLLRGDRKFPKHLVDKIFACDKQNQKQGQKRVHKAKRLKKMAELKEKKNEYEKQQKDITEASTTVKTNDEDMDDDLSEDDNAHDSEDIDSDEFCSVEQPQSSDPRAMVGYNEDCLDIYCDESDLF